MTADAGRIGETDLLDVTMDEILRRHPEVIRVVNAKGMLCVGCLLASFHDLQDAAHAHDLDVDDLARDVRTAIADAVIAPE